jgi:2'-5' RNA ligase
MYTPGGPEGLPPHVTLLYPFIEADELTAAEIDRVRAVVGRFQAFDFTLADVGRFDNLPEYSQSWLAPTPADPFVALIAALAAAFPAHQPFGAAYPTIIPHLTFASSTDGEVLRRAEAEAATTLPIEARATSAVIMEHVAGRWRVRAEAPLACDHPARA